MLTGRDLLLYLAYKYKSDYPSMLEAMRNKVKPEESAVLEVKDKLDCDFVTLIDDKYPKKLKLLHEPPLVLFYKGDLDILDNDKKIVGVVGSRNCSDYGKRATTKVIQDLKDVITVSGLAKGIDAIGHLASLNRGLKTIGVIGSGFYNFYPSENYSLYKRIIDEGGLVLSEYHPTIEPKPEFYARRNRIIAGLCDFLLVGEAYKKSGSSITVQDALLLGKDVGCIPYPFDKESMCNSWIKQGAFMIETGNDLMYDIKNWKIYYISIYIMEIQPFIIVWQRNDSHILLSFENGKLWS